MGDANPHTAESGGESKERGKRLFQVIGVIVVLGLLVGVFNRGNHHKTTQTATVSAPVQAPTTVTETPAPATDGLVTCTAMTEGMEVATCEFGEAGTARIPVMASRNAHNCMSGDFGSPNVQAWYTSADDGQEHLWTGTSADRLTPKTFWRFATIHGSGRISYRVLFPLGACPVF